MNTETSKHSSDQTELEHALQIAKLGFRVFPLEPNGKIPVFPAWPKMASRDPKRIKDWWIEPVMGVYQGFNVGVTGGLFLDIDCKNGVDGKAALKELTNEYGALPPTIAVQTPSGGEHYYFLPDSSVGNSVGKIGSGLDIRADGGYVVGAGSKINNKSYLWLTDDNMQVVECPKWLVEKARCARPVSKSSLAPAIELDRDDAIDRAIFYLDNEAKPAIEGDGGDHTTFQVAADVKDYGISENRCLELMLDHWNERCSPPWPPEDLQIKVTNAYRYGVEAAGSKSPDSDFDSHKGVTAVSKIAPQLIMPYQDNELPPRHWVLGRLLLKGHVTVVVAPPSAGKSTMTLQAAVSIVSGKASLLNMPVHERQRVWMYNNEDDLVEMKRRLSAIKRHFKLDWRDLEINGQLSLFLNSGENRALTIAKRSADGKTLEPYDLALLISYIKKEKIGVFIVDPFLETHAANENSNEEINRVTRMFRHIAKQTDCAVMLVHHTRKAPQSSSVGHVGNMDSARGASSLMGVARVAVTLYSMSAKDAEEYRVLKNDRHCYVRLDDAKSNMTLLTHKPRWFKRVSVKIPNSNTDQDLAFDEVGVLAPQNLNDIHAAINQALCADVLDVMHEDCESARAIAQRMIDSNPMYSETKPLTLARRLMKHFATPPGSQWLGASI